MVKYIDANNPFHYCEKGSGIFSSTSLHYVWDVNPNLRFLATLTSGCSLQGGGFSSI